MKRRRHRKPTAQEREETARILRDYIARRKPERASIEHFHQLIRSGKLGKLIDAIVGVASPQLVYSYVYTAKRGRQSDRVVGEIPAPGTRALVVAGPSRGTVVRLGRLFYAPPGTDACAVHTLQAPGPIWAVDKFLRWDVRGRRYRYMIAPQTGVRVLKR
jgi:hypothetical protein